MKKILSLSILFLSITSFGQEHPWYIGGGLSANTSSSNVTAGTKSRSSWEVSPEIGRFVSPRIQVGASINIGENRTKYFIGDQSVAHAFGGGIYGRYLFGEKAFKPFVGVKIGYNMNSDSWFDYSDGTSLTSAYINAGFSYSLSPRWTIFGSYGMLGYSRSRDSGMSEDLITDNFGINMSTLGNRFLIGMYYSFGKTKE